MEPTLSRQSSEGITITTQIIPGNALATNLLVTTEYIVLTLNDAKIYVFDSDGTYRKTFQGHSKPVWALAIVEDTLLSGGADNDIRVWDFKTGECNQILTGHRSTIRCIKFIDKHKAVSGSKDGTLRIWDLDTGLQLNKLEGHVDTIRVLEIRNDMMFSAGTDSTCKIWSLQEGRCLKTLEGHKGVIYTLTLTEDETQVITASLDKTVRIWDITSGSSIAVLEGHTSVVSQLRVFGSTLFSAGADGHFRVWSLENMKLLKNNSAHDGAVVSMQVDGERLITGGTDGRVRLWNWEEGKLIRELGEIRNVVWKVGFGKKGSIVVAGMRKGETGLEVYEGV